MKQNKPNFTPGPWNLDLDKEHDQNAFTYHVRSNDRKQICTVNPYVDAKQDHANANLIAAAPDMYEALEKLCNEPECPDHIAAYLLPVLAKARGES